MWLWKAPNTSGPAHTHQVDQIRGLGPETLGTMPAAVTCCLGAGESGTVKLSHVSRVT